LIAAMSRMRIFSTYIIVDLTIVGGVVWCVFHGWSVRQYLIPAAVLFVLSGVWLVVMTVKNTPPTDGLGN
jgi:hypothetical protein